MSARAIAGVTVLAFELNEALNALREFESYFKSGNDIPIERATILANSVAVTKMREVLRSNSDA